MKIIAFVRDFNSGKRKNVGSLLKIRSLGIFKYIGWIIYLRLFRILICRNLLFRKLT